ncbi:hypothetical protein SeLEV6574_g08312 [Synchytrium endobioticum]|uniref:Ndc10 domain-containing protein n=1 Tax=Synchytrium endobioticum TaxID=286115 RepID=A0A507BXT4_9FUNG|nr:hypothetical protein SeLEV6574_g08312 [Synchytrium endobioticum]
MMLLIRLCQNCGVFGLAIYLFWRYHVANEKFPNLLKREEWYDIALLLNHSYNEKRAVALAKRRASKRKRPASRTSRNESIDEVDGPSSSDSEDEKQGKKTKRQLSKPGGRPNEQGCHTIHNVSLSLMHSNLWVLYQRQKTHARRHAGTHILQMKEIDDHNLSLAGRWEGSVAEKHYMIKIPFKAVREMAGFPVPPYHPDRNCFAPSEDLERQIFPEMNTMKAN